jgi:predicted transcriptional regulator YdeE
MKKIDVVTKSFTAIGTLHKSINFDKDKKEAMPLAINTLKSRLDEIHNRTGDGIMTYGFEGIEHGGCIWNVAAEVSLIENIPEGMVPIEFPEMQYAHYHYSGSINDIGNAYNELFDWINKNGDSGNGGSMIERWGNSFPSENEQCDMHLYLPFMWKNNNKSE